MDHHNQHRLTTTVADKRILKIGSRPTTDNSTTQLLSLKKSANNHNLAVDDLIGQSHGNKNTNQSYSSRNSLRSAQSSTNDSGNNSSGPAKNMLNYYNRLDNRYDQSELSDTSNYTSLNIDTFLRTIGGYTYCILCGSRERCVDVPTDYHVDSETHVNNFRTLRQSLVDQIPEDDSVQMQAIRELLDKWLAKIYLTEEQVIIRHNVMQEFNYIVNAINSSCRCRLLGSFANGTSLVTSDVNLELMHPNSKLFESDPRARNSVHHKLIEPEADYGRQINYHTIHYDLTPNALETLHKIALAIGGNFCQPQSNYFQLISSIDDLNRKVPRLRLVHLTSRVEIEVSCYAQASYRLSNLLKLYTELDSRAKILCLLVKYWAKICLIDRPDHGTYSPETFVILVIYYLQRVSPPILPCLQEWNSKSARQDVESTRTDNVQAPNSPGRSSELIKDPSESLLNEPEQADEVEEQLEEEEEDDCGFLDLDDSDLNTFEWTSVNSESVPRLFLGFMRFMFEEFNNIATIISIRSLKPITLRSKKWKTSVKGIEDPVKPRVNLSRCLGTSRTFMYIRECFKNAFYYLTCIPLDFRLSAITEKQIDPSDYIEIYVDEQKLDFYFRMKEKMLSRKKIDTIEEMIQQNLFSRDIEVISNLVRQVPPARLATTLSNFYKNEFLLPSDVASTTHCWLCKRFGHTRFDCPKGKREHLRGVPFFEGDLDQDKKFLDYYFHDRIGPRLAQEHALVVADLTKIISRATNLNVILKPFGSTVNQMGSSDSDLDICIIVEGNLTGNGVDCVKVLQVVNEALHQERWAHSIESILTARVPIIRFKYGKFDIDLSMYNQCAIHNSMLLRTYAEYDERAPQLFYLVKKFAKACDIADASKGSLSSYAWALLVIHYLQRTVPPILPFLQEAPRSQQKPIFGVNGWNVWFDDTVGTMEVYNDTGITGLLLGFFYYYGNFDFELEVVSIRQRRRMTRFRKNWYNCPMAIEDPFELTYNLACRLDEQMGIFIINSFAQAYRHIREKLSNKSQPRDTQERRSFLDRVFDWRRITGVRPLYRGCKLCHRLGHRVSDCQQRKK